MSKEARRNRKERILEEIKRLMAIIAYLFVLLTVFQLHRALILREHEIHYNYGQGLIFALINAWVLGKFVLVGESLYRGEHWQRKPLMYLVLLKSAICGMILIVCCNGARFFPSTRATFLELSPVWTGVIVPMRWGAEWRTGAQP
jgi:hypothetical protein